MTVHGRLALIGLIDSLPASWTRKRRQAWLRAVVKAADYVVDIEPDDLEANYAAALRALELMLKPGSAAQAVEAASKVLARREAVQAVGRTTARKGERAMKLMPTSAAAESERDGR